MISKRLMVNVMAVATAVMLRPSTAAAQRVYPVHHSNVRVAVGVGFGYYPYYPFYAGFGWYPGWYPYPYAFYPPYPGYYYPSYASIRVQVTPKQAHVYLDGYYVGVVDDFDGVFQRLDAPTGQHDLQVYMQGYKTLSQKMLFRPGQTYKVTAALQPLTQGEQQEPPPVAAPRPQRQPPPPGAYAEPQGPYPAPQGRRTQPPPERGDEPSNEAGFGTVVIRVQPADAVVVIDGDRWDSPEGGSKLQVQLSGGPHRIEISKDGYKTYSTSLTVRPGDTQSLNVSLSAGS